jgi:mannosyltransferase
VVAKESGERRALLRDAGIAFGAAAAAFLPWLPTLLYQAAHTGAPWSTPPSPFELVGGFSTVLAGQGSLVAVVLAGGVGLVRVIEGERSTVRTAILAILILAVATLLAGWLFSQFTPAWASRYLGVLVGPIMLAVAVGLSRAGRLGLVALALVVVFWGGYWATDEKSNVAKLERLFGDRVRAGDVILSTQPEQVPVIAYYFGYEHVYASPLGPFADARVMDWRDALERLEAAQPETTLEPIIRRMEEGQRLVLIRPFIRSNAPWRAPWTELVRQRSFEWRTALAFDERLTRTTEYVPPYTERAHRPLVLEIYEKTTRG